MINKNRIKEFLNNSQLEIYITDNKVLSVGLKWGYSKILKENGFKRKEQINILNYLEKNTNILKENDYI